MRVEQKADMHGDKQTEYEVRHRQLHEVVVGDVTADLVTAGEGGQNDAIQHEYDHHQETFHSCYADDERVGV